MGLNLDNIIEASERIEAQAEAQRRQPRQRAVARKTAPRPVVAEEHTYNYKDEIERLTTDAQIGGISEENLEKSGLPQNIIDSFKSSPCLFDPRIISEMGDPNVAKMQERLAQKGIGKKNGNSAFDRMKSLNERVDAIDGNGTTVRTNKTTQTITENNIHGGFGGASLDYPTLRALMVDAVKEVLNEELSKIKAELLTENRNNNTNSGNLSIMSLKDNFFFVDDKDNVFECIMKYKGKNQRRQK